MATITRITTVHPIQSIWIGSGRARMFVGYLVSWVVHFERTPPAAKMVMTGIYTLMRSALPV
jgi:hypothetical protein